MVKSAEGITIYQQEMPGLELVEVYLVPGEHEPSKCKYGQRNYRKMIGIHIEEVIATSAENALKNAPERRCIDIHPDDGCESIIKYSFPKTKKSHKGLPVPI